MKKMLSLLLVLLLTACGAKPADPESTDNITVVNASEEVKVTLDKDLYPVGTQSVTVVLENTSDRTLMYGRDYSFQKDVDGVWTSLPSISNAAFTMEGILLDPGKSATIVYSTWFLQQPQLSQGTYLLTGSVLTLLGQNGAPDENLPPWQVEFTVSSQAGDISTTSLEDVPPAANGDLFIQIDPPQGDSIPFSVYNTSGRDAEILLIPTLYRQNDAGDWEEVPVDEGIGFCGTPDPLPPGEKQWSVPVSTLWGNLYAGEYRLSYQITDAKGQESAVMGQFTLTEDICQLPRAE